jgi:hypothetical protein
LFEADHPLISTGWWPPLAVSDREEALRPRIVQLAMMKWFRPPVQRL